MVQFLSSSIYSQGGTAKGEGPSVIICVGFRLDAELSRAGAITESLSGAYLDDVVLDKRWTPEAPRKKVHYRGRLADTFSTP